MSLITVVEKYGQMKNTAVQTIIPTDKYVRVGSTITISILVIKNCDFAFEKWKSLFFST